MPNVGDSSATVPRETVVQSVSSEVSPPMKADGQSHVVDCWELWRQLHENSLVSVGGTTVSKK